MAGLGYPQATIARVASLVKKERLKADPEAQALEDVVCLVFLAHVFEGFAAQHDDAKVVDIIQKTWRKMSDHGRQAALGLTLSARPARLIETALAP